MSVVNKLDGLLSSAQEELKELSSSRASTNQEADLLDARKSELASERARLLRLIAETKRQLANKQTECNQIEKDIAKARTDLKHLKLSCDTTRTKYSQDLNKAYRKHRPRFDPRLPVLDGPSEPAPTYSTSVPELSQAIEHICCMIQPGLRRHVNGVRKIPDLACLQAQIAQIVNIFRNYEIVSVDTDCAKKLDLAPLEIDHRLWSEIVEQTSSLAIQPPPGPS